MAQNQPINIRNGPLRGPWPVLPLQRPAWCSPGDLSGRPRNGQGPTTAWNGPKRVFLIMIGPICAMWLIIGPRGLIFPLPAWGFGMSQILMFFKGETANYRSGALQGPIGPSVGLDLLGFDWVCSGWIGSDWVGLGWIGLGRIGSDWVGLDWVGSDWVGWGSLGLAWVGLRRVGLDWIGLGRIRLDRLGLGWLVGLGGIGLDWSASGEIGSDGVGLG